MKKRKINALGGFKGVGRFMLSDVCQVCFEKQPFYVVFDYKVKKDFVLSFEYLCVCIDCYVNKFK